MTRISRFMLLSSSGGLRRGAGAFAYFSIGNPGGAGRAVTKK
jgi:hypothetical protein